MDRSFLHDTARHINNKLDFLKGGFALHISLYLIKNYGQCQVRQFASFSKEFIISYK
jgi:hypothetical protein